jgi:hypothetical protein
MDPRPPRKRPIIGPFLALAILLSGGIMVWHKQRERQVQPTAPRPVVERQVITEVPAGTENPPMTLVRDRAADLRLTPQQVKTINALAAAYEEELAPLRVRAEAAASRFASGRQVPARKRVSAEELQRQMQPVSDYSHQMVVLRAAYWQKAARTLTEQQQEQARQLWREQLSGSRRPQT